VEFGINLGAFLTSRRDSPASELAHLYPVSRWCGADADEGGDAV
jgi:hypothetical protein